MVSPDSGSFGQESITTASACLAFLAMQSDKQVNVITIRCMVPVADSQIRYVPTRKLVVPAASDFRR